MTVRALRCSDGHLFSASRLKLLFGSGHFIDKVWLRCPVDRKWRMAGWVGGGALSDAELDEAQRHRF